jgi:membrane-bound lytic murein transglycosylase D
MHISNLLEFNQLSIRDTLFIGQIIQVNKLITEYKATEVEVLNSKTKTINENSTENTGVTQHTVQPGETMYALAKKYQVSLKELMDWNQKSDFSISQGEIIIIKKK